MPIGPSYPDDDLTPDLDPGVRDALRRLRPVTPDFPPSLDARVLADADKALTRPRPLWTIPAVRWSMAACLCLVAGVVLIIARRPARPPLPADHGTDTAMLAQSEAAGPHDQAGLFSKKEQAESAPTRAELPVTAEADALIGASASTRSAGGEVPRNTVTDAAPRADITDAMRLALAVQDHRATDPGHDLNNDGSIDQQDADLLALRAVRLPDDAPAPPAAARSRDVTSSSVSLDIFIDAGPRLLGAYQVDLRLTTPGAVVTEIEGGTAPGYADAPFHDARAIGTPRVILGAFSPLRTGVVQVLHVARVRIRVPGAPLDQSAPRIECDARVLAAADHLGARLSGGVVVTVRPFSSRGVSR